LFIVPVTGGTPRELFRGVGRAVWTSDSRALLALKAPPDRQELWVVPIDGSAPRNLGIEVHDSSGQIPFSLRPDGRQIAFVAGNASPSSSEIWRNRELSSGAERQPMILALLALALVIPVGLDLYMPVPEEDPLTVEKIELGGGYSTTAASHVTKRSPAHRVMTRRAHSRPRSRLRSVFSGASGGATRRP
jgi:hypothetical protein